MVDDAWGEPASPAKLKAALEAHPEASLVAFVHAETSTGAQSDAQALAAIAHEHDCLVLVDAVTSLGGTPVEVDAWGWTPSTRGRRSACRARRASPR